MSIGSSSLALAVLAGKQLRFSGGPNYFGDGVQVALTGHGSNAADTSLLVFRGSTLVASCGAFSGGTSSATGSVDLYTSELSDVFDGVAFNSFVELSCRIYNNQSFSLIGHGWWPVVSPGFDYQDDSGLDPVSPVTGSTVIWGHLARYNGATYGYNSDDGLWYPVAFRGAGGLIHIDLDQPGITITP